MGRLVHYLVYVCVCVCVCILLPKRFCWPNLFRTSNLIGSCWCEALLFKSWGSLLVFFGLGLSMFS